ncbi:leucine-rich repeat-containing protein 15-like [Montipora capricornis]|uniref:leucine-rich repeat-containing protein 15-like n=1 Tax=Montipora capricornis TaxID=246305 RepID=UPI0035F17BF3
MDFRLKEMTVAVFTLEDGKLVRRVTRLTSLPSEYISGRMKLLNSQRALSQDSHVYLISKSEEKMAIAMDLKAADRGANWKISEVSELRRYLDKNKISQLAENVFSGLSGLRSLYLRENEITQLPESAFSGLTRLSSLYLDKNKISQLAENVFSGLSGLRLLYLRENEITQLPESAFSGLTRLSSLCNGAEHIGSCDNDADDDDHESSDVDNVDDDHDYDDDDEEEEEEEDEGDE